MFKRLTCRTFPCLQYANNPQILLKWKWRYWTNTTIAGFSYNFSEIFITGGIFGKFRLVCKSDLTYDFDYLIDIFWVTYCGFSVINWLIKSTLGYCAVGKKVRISFKTISWRGRMLHHSVFRQRGIEKSWGKDFMYRWYFELFP